MNNQEQPAKLHLSLRVSDLERSVAFYQAFLGLPPHKRRAGYANFDAAQPPVKLALMEKPAQTEAGPLDHLGLLVADTAAVTAISDRLKQAGLAPEEEMNTTCCHARQDKIWVHDPDGVAWEVYAVTDDMLDQPEPADSASVISCCR